MLLKEVKRRTGLTRKQLRYLEDRGLIGPVIRSDERRMFTELQVAMLERLARLRDLGARLDEAAALAAEAVGGEAKVPEERLRELMARALSETRHRAQVAEELGEIARGRTRTTQLPLRV